VFRMRASHTAGRQQDPQAHPAAPIRQIHILTTRGDLPVEQVIYRVGSRLRQENYFRYAWMQFDLDSDNAYATTDDAPPGWSLTRPRRKPTNNFWPHGPATNGHWPPPTRPYSKQSPHHRESRC
jgi:hypothetical protein